MGGQQQLYQEAAGEKIAIAAVGRSIPVTSGVGGGGSRRGPPPGPGCYHRTLSSSSLLSGKVVQVAKSRSEYCGINQVWGRGTGSNFDLRSGNTGAHQINANLRTSNLSRSGNIIYSSGRGLVGGCDGDVGGVIVEGETSGPPPPERRHLVRLGSRNAFTLQQQPHQGYWQEQKQSAEQYSSSPYNSSTAPSTFEEQWQLQQQQREQFFLLSKVQRRVVGSHPDISSSSGNSSGVTPQQPHQQGPSSTSPTTTRRLLPRITTKKTENSSTVMLVCETRNPNSLPNQYHSSAAGTIIDIPPPTPPPPPLINQPKPSYIFSSPSLLRRASSPPPFPHHYHYHPQKTDILPTIRTLSSPTTTSPHPQSQDYRPQHSPAPNLAPSHRKGISSHSTLKLPRKLSPYYKNASIQKLQHPLEENIFTSLFITLFAIAVALFVGVPLLIFLGGVVLVALCFRYIIAIIHGLALYTRFICSNRQHPSNRSLSPQIFPRDRLAYANDVRWLAPKRKSRCQSILHTLLVFEGSIELTTFRHLIQTRILRAETPEGELLYPRLLQKLNSLTSGYIWELDLTFDIQNHVFSGPTHFTSEAELQKYIGRLLTVPLPMGKPLWEIRLLPSYYGSGKDTMAILRVHQCLADGMSLIRMLSHALADHQQMHVPQRPHFAGLSFGFNVLRSLIVGPVTIFLWWFGTFKDKNLFSIPLPKQRGNIKRSRRRRTNKSCMERLWGILRIRRNRPDENGEGSECEENQEILSFTSSIGSSSASLSSITSSGSSVASSNSSQKRKGASSPVASLNQQNISTSANANNAQGGADAPPKKTGFFSRSTPKRLANTGSRSSLKTSEDPGVVGKYKKRCKKLKKSRKHHKKKRGKRHKRNNKKGRHKKRIIGRRSSPLSNSLSSFSSSHSSSLSSFSLHRRHLHKRNYSSITSLCGNKIPSWNVIWSAPLSLPKVGRVKQIMRSSYNDVLISAMAGSIRSYLQQMGIPFPGDVQVVIPVDLRNDVASPKVSSRIGCKVASVLSTIPSGIESAIPRLWATRHRLDELKASADSVVAYGATTLLMNLLPQRIAIPILESILNKASLQFSNIPGPTSTTVIGGYPLKGIYPIYPPPGSLRAAVTVITYADQVHLSVVTHKSLTNAGPSLLRGITDQIDQLSRQLSQRRVPGESRRSTRNFQANQEITKPPTRQIQLKLQIVQEEMAQLNSRLEAEGIIVSDTEYGFLQASRRVTSSGATGTGGYYHVPQVAQQQQSHHYQQHHPHYPSSGVHYHPPNEEEDTVDYYPSSSTPSMTEQPCNASGAELQNRLKSLKNEFAQLIGELRRRSSIVEGIAMSFEDEEIEEEYRKPRKRALSVVSMTRRSSIFSSRSNNATPESPAYSSDEDMPSSPQLMPAGGAVTSISSSSGASGGGTATGTLPTAAVGYSAASVASSTSSSSGIRHTSSPMRTTAV